MQLSPELKLRQPATAKRVLSALDLQADMESTVVSWRDFLRLSTILKYYTASKKEYLDFWMKFFNPDHMPLLPVDELYTHLELLVRGSYTEESTLLSEKFAKGFCRLLYRKDCVLKHSGTAGPSQALLAKVSKYMEPAAAAEYIKSKTQDTTQADTSYLVDMKKLAYKLRKGDIDIEFLNQVLKGDSEYVVPSDDEADEIERQLLPDRHR